MKVNKFLSPCLEDCSASGLSKVCRHLYDQGGLTKNFIEGGSNFFLMAEVDQLTNHGANILPNKEGIDHVGHDHWGYCRCTWSKEMACFLLFFLQCLLRSQLCLV